MFVSIFQIGDCTVEYTPRKKRNPKPEGPVITPLDVTAALKLAAQGMSDADAAAYIVKNWDIILRTEYAWPILWSLLTNLGWVSIEAVNYSISPTVLVPVWAVEEYEAKGRNPACMVKNRTFYIDQDDVRTYIAKYGANQTEAPASPEKRRSREKVSASSNSGSETVNDSLQEQPYLNSLQLILEKKALIAAEAALKRKQNSTDNQSHILRIKKDYASLQEDLPGWVREIELIDDDITNWRVAIKCLDHAGPFKDATLTIDLTFGIDYPYKQPIVKFTHQIFHPNIDFATGVLCTDGKWAVIYDVQMLLFTIRHLLTYPSVAIDGSENPVNLEAAVLYSNEPESYFEVCQKLLELKNPILLVSEGRDKEGIEHLSNSSDSNITNTIEMRPGAANMQTGLTKLGYDEIIFNISRIGKEFKSLINEMPYWLREIDLIDGDITKWRVVI